MPRSAFQGLEQGVASLRLPGAPWPEGYDTVLEYDNFDAGFSGWQDHTEYKVGSTVVTGNTEAHAPISLSEARSAFNSRRSMVLATSVSRATSTQHGSQCTTFKRASRTHEDGYLAVFFHWALRTIAEQASPQYVKFDVDTQYWDNSGRVYGSLALRRFTGAGPDTYGPRWSLRNGSSGYTDIPNAAETDGEVFGWNENKAGFSWAGMVLDYDQPAAAAYSKAYTGKTWHDLTGVTADSSETPQDGLSGGTSFAGGQNYGATILNRGATDDGPARLYISDVVVLHYPAGFDWSVI